MIRGKLTGSFEGLSKRQKKRLQRRLSRTKDAIVIPETIIPDQQIKENSRTNSESSDWQTVRRSSSVVNQSSPIIQNAVNGNVTANGNDIELENMFDLLNHSQHEDESTLAKHRPCLSTIPMTKRKVLVSNGNHFISDSSATTSRSVTPISDSSPYKLAKNVSKKLGKTSKKRSKSTSPPRKIESSASKQKDMFKHFDPDRVDWIQKNHNAKY